MVKHIVALNCKDDISPEEKLLHMKKTKELLEGLKDCIPGIVEFSVQINLLPTSNRDIVFNTIFESPEALAEYQVHPDHVKVAEYVRSVMKDRICVDYIL